MRKHPLITLALFFLVLVSARQLSAQTATPATQTETHNTADTVIVRLNNKLYYTLTDNGRWRVNEDNKVVFTTLNPNDTSPDIGLEYIGSKPSLVKMLRKGDTIANCLVGDIKLSFADFMDKIQQKNATQNVCSRNLIFMNCVFSRVMADTSDDLLEDDSKVKKKLNFTNDIQFLNCNFPKGLEVSDCIFQKNFILTGQLTASSVSSIGGCEFHGLCYIYSSPNFNKGSSYLKVNSCTFNGACILSVSDNDKTHITLERCKFNNIFSLGKSIPQYLFKKFHGFQGTENYAAHIRKYYTAYADFLENKYAGEHYVTVDSIENFLPVSRIIYNVSLVRCKARIIDIANANMMDCSLEDVTVLKYIDVTGSNFAYSSNYPGKQALEDIDFPNNDGVIYASYKTFLPEAFKLNIYMQKVYIHPLVHNYFDTTTDFMQDNSNFYSMLKDYAAKKFTNQDMETTLKARFQHEEAYWERSYYAAHVAHSKGVGDFIRSAFQLTLGWFLEITVANGYKGEWRFALWVLFLILLFTSIYFSRHREAVIDYLNSKFNKEEDLGAKYATLKVYGPFNWFRDFMRCLWFSCMVFIDPRLPINFFNLRVGLFGLVLAEWLCGITAILLFLIFLASNYPFIHTLIGIG